MENFRFHTIESQISQKHLLVHFTATVDFSCVVAPGHSDHSTPVILFLFFVQSPNSVKGPKSEVSPRVRYTVVVIEEELSRLRGSPPPPPSDRTQTGILFEPSLLAGPGCAPA